MRVKISFCLLTSVLALGASARADLTNCDGVWTNKPCSGDAEKAMAESKPTPRSQRDIDADQKRMLISELDTRRLTVRGQYGIDVGISAERSLCANPDTSVTECAHAVNEKEKYFDERAAAAASLKAEPTQAGDSAPSRDSGTITIIQQSGDQYIGGRPHYRRTPSPWYTPPPIYTGAPVEPPHVRPPRPTVHPIDPPYTPKPPSRAGWKVHRQ